MDNPVPIIDIFGRDFSDMDMPGMDIAVFHDFLSRFTSLDKQAEEQENNDAKLEIKKWSGFFNEFSSLRQKLQKSGTNFNIWRVAGLTEKEAPATRILKWFLEPGEAHGLGKAFMESILHRVPNECWHNGKGPVEIGADYTVMYEFPFKNEDYLPENAENESVEDESDTDDEGEAGQESAPDLENSTSSDPGASLAPAEDPSLTAKMRSTKGSRPDLLIVGADFLLVIEIKTGTGEHDSQLSRYATIAGQIAANKPWALVYLTPAGKSSTDYQKAFPLAWRDVGSAFRKVIRDRELTPAKLACEHFCEYIEELKG